MRKKIVLAHPCYGPLDPTVNKSLRVAIMHASRHHDWVGDVSTIREGWVGARNKAARSAIHDANADGVFWVDDDVLLPAEAFSRLLSYDKDFVTGILYQKAGEYNPLIAKWKKTGYAWFSEFPENVLMKADGCGFGICYTSTKMLQAVEEQFKDSDWFDPFPPNSFGKQDGDPMMSMSEDFSFCKRASMAGYQLYADTGLQCGHMKGPRFVTREMVDKIKTKNAEERASREALFHRLEKENSGESSSADRGWQLSGIEAAARSLR